MCWCAASSPAQELQQTGDRLWFTQQHPPICHQRYIPARLSSLLFPAFGPVDKNPHVCCSLCHTLRLLATTYTHVVLLCTHKHSHPQGAVLEVKAHNERAIALYRRHGFEEVGRRPKFYACGADAVLMARQSQLERQEES